MSALRFGAVVSAHLDDALEVNIHRVGELEGLEVRETDDRRRRAKVLYLLEFTHNLWSHDASMLVNELNWSALSIVGDTITHQHVEFVLIILDCQYHRHGLSDLHDSTDF